MSSSCLTDRTSLTGLRALIRRRPRDWHHALLDGAAWGDPGEEATIAEVLRSGIVARLSPRHAGDGGRLRRERSGAARLVRAVGDTRISDVDDGFVEQLRGELTTDPNSRLGTPLAASTASRTLTVLREAARAWADHVGVPTRVGRGSGPSRRVGARKARPVPTLLQIEGLLRASPTYLRAAIGLAVGGGMTEREILRLRRGQFDLANHRVILLATVPGVARDIRRIRYSWLPAWATDLLRSTHPSLRSMDRRAFLFPSPKRWGWPRNSLNTPLARACSEAFGEVGPRYTFGDLRRAWQALGRAHGLPRAVVRQSWSIWTPPPGHKAVLHDGVLSLKRLMTRWRTLGDGTGQPLRDPLPVPMKAAKGTAPGDPEPIATRDLGGELPPSCSLWP